MQAIFLERCLYLTGANAATNGFAIMISLLAIILSFALIVRTSRQKDAEAARVIATLEAARKRSRIG